VSKVEAWAARHPDVGLRLYRTAGGLRVIFTHDLFDPAHSSTRVLLQALESDPLYVRLCQDQACFRARLTPKPWRMRLGAPRAHYPFLDARQQAEFDRWLHKYEQQAAGYAVCRLLKTWGDPRPHPEVAAVIEAHDRIAAANPDLTLA
jgi:hypothetical protein